VQDSSDADARIYRVTEQTFVTEDGLMTGTEMNLRLLALCSVEGVNWNVIAREALRAGGLARLLAGEVAEASRDGEATRRRLSDSLPTLEDRVERVREMVDGASHAVGAKLVTVLDRGRYPSNLRVVPSPPPFLFYRGELARGDARSVAVVGTRRASDEGRRRARSLAEKLAADDVTVVSGLAKGIDTEAHTATLDVGGRTIAVIGTGILRTYPKENAQLAERVAERGAVVSQFWPDAPPTRYSFPMRNAVMSGISQGTAVIEASETSGAKMQARIALEQGKRAFLMASLVTSEPWAQRYMQRGAIEVESVDDVLRWLRTPDQVEQQSTQRDQLSLELA
jgi:DNA processing protein